MDDIIASGRYFTVRLIFKKSNIVQICELGEMENETSEPCTKDWHAFTSQMKEHIHCHGCGGAIYGLGFLGALWYYLTTATSLLAGFLVIIKALLWPAFLVYGVLKFIGM